MRSSSGIRTMFEQGAALKKKYGADRVFDFSLGNPVLEPPAAVTQALLNRLSAPPAQAHAYMHNSGHEAVRAYLADELRTLTGQPFVPQNITLSCGAAGGLSILFNAVLDPGDEVICLAPYFPEYRFYVRHAGGALVVSQTDALFQPDMADLAEKITAKTRAVLINTPNNPTGAVYSDATMTALAALLREKSAGREVPLLLINDEPYRNMIFDGQAPVFVSRYYEHSATVYSYSKELGIPGERLGYVAVSPGCYGAEELAAALNVTNRILGFVNAPALFQQILPALSGVTVDYGYYRKNRDDLSQILHDVGLVFPKPAGAFYIFLPVPDGADGAFCANALEHNILLVPGSAFGRAGYCRIAYCVPHSVILRSKDAFAAFVESYKKTYS